MLEKSDQHGVFEKAIRTFFALLINPPKTGYVQGKDIDKILSKQEEIV